ncbi:MAG: aminoglycoside 6-adenylyltransferase [Pseudomonadales bacterium]
MKVLPKEEVLSLFHDWVASATDVRAAILTGSRVNPRARVDRLSDYDIELYVDDLEPYWLGDDWLADLGTPLAKCPWQPGSFKEGWLTRLVLFKEGFRIDFQITDSDLATENYLNGYQILFDLDDLCSDLPLPTYEGYKISRPDADEWNKFAHEFWWDATYVAKTLAREELFYAKYTLDVVLRFNYLQKLIEWTIGIEHGWDAQPNKFGRDFDRFIDEARWRQITRTFADADLAANWRAFYATLDLFRELGHKVADELAYDYPQTLEDEVTAYVSLTIGSKVADMGYCREDFGHRQNQEKNI